MEVRELEPGEYEVFAGEATHRVVIPAGVGLPGVGDEELAAAVVAELVERRRVGDRPIDVSAVLHDDPGLLLAVERRVLPDES